MIVGTMVKATLLKGSSTKLKFIGANNLGLVKEEIGNTLDQLGWGTIAPTPAGLIFFRTDPCLLA